MVTALDLLFEIRDRYGLSTADMGTLLGVSNNSLQRWVTGKSEMPHEIFTELIDIEQDIMWLYAYMKANPDLLTFTHAHFKAAINSLAV